jgi:antitoxin VapB
MLGKVFQNGRSQAIRIPKEFRVDCDEVYIDKVGDTLVIKPKEKSKWDVMREAVEDLDGLDLEVEDLPVQERDLF